MNIFSYLTDPANWEGPAGIWNLLLQQLAYTAASVGIAAAIAIPLGIFGLGLLGWVPFGPAGFSARTQKSGVNEQHRRIRRQRAGFHVVRNGKK